MREFIILLLALVLLPGSFFAGGGRAAHASFPQVASQGAIEAQPGQGAFLILSDIHFDPFADPAIVSRLVAAPVEDWPAILQSSRDQRISRGPQDTNYPLLQSAVNAAQQAARNSGVPVEFVLVNGDFLAHNFTTTKAAAFHLAGASLQEFAVKTAVFVSRTIQMAFPNTPVISAFGNNDSVCGDDAAPGGALLAALAKEWGAVAAHPDAANDFLAGGYYAIPHPVLSNQELIVLNSTFWSANYRAGCTAGPGDFGAAELQWLAGKLAQARAAHKTAALVMHIPPGADSFTSARRADCNQPAPFWKPQYVEGFLSIIETNKDVVRDAYAGHTHHDDFRVLADSSGGPLLQVHITPAVSPVYSNNPAFEIARYEKRSGAFADYSVVALRNYFDPQSAPARAGAAPQWREEYDFRRAYGAASAGPADFATLAAEIRSDSAVRARFERFYGAQASRPPDITPGNWRYFSCAQTDSSSAAYSRCVCPVPSRR